MLDDNSFYYNAGLVFADILGNRTLAERKKYVNQFKKFVDEAGGPEAFRTAEEAAKQFFYSNKRSRTNGKRS